MQKAHAIAVHAQVTPVSVENILGFLGHFQGVQHFIDRIAARLDKVGERLFHIVGIGVAVDGIGIGLSIPNLIAQFKKFSNGLAGFRTVFHHFLNESLLSKGHDTVILLIGGDQVVRFRDAHPVDFILHPQIPEQFSDIARLLGRTKIVQLMQACFKLKTPPFKAGGKPAGQIVLLQQQAGIPRL